MVEQDSLQSLVVHYMLMAGLSWNWTLKGDWNLD